MSTQLLIYETAIPVSSARHAKCSVEGGKGYGFTRKLNSVPLMAVEFPEAEPEYAIVFAGEGDAVMPAVILGAGAENLYLGANDAWQAKYVPAFLRRYPFVFSATEEGKSFTLCVDEVYPGVNFQGRGQPLFTSEGKPSEYTDNVLKFLQTYRTQFVRTQAFCKTLREHNLLEPMQAEFTLGTGEKMALRGFMVVSRAKLKALSGDALATLAKSDALELIYLHLQSVRNFWAVKDKLVQAAVSKPQPAAEVAEAATTDAPAPAPEKPAKAGKSKNGKERSDAHAG